MCGAKGKKRQTHKSTRWAQLQKKTEILVAKVSVVKVTANSVVAESHTAYCVAASALTAELVSYCVSLLMSPCVFCYLSLFLSCSYLSDRAVSNFGGVVCYRLRKIAH